MALSFKPDIIANYLGNNNKKLDHLRISVDLMLTDMKKIANIEHHTPFLRDAFVNIISKEREVLFTKYLYH